MHTLTNHENKEDPIVLQKEKHEFSQSDKMEALSTFHIMAKDLISRNEPLGQQYANLLPYLQSLPPVQLQKCLESFLAPQSLTNIVNIKSFIFLKKLTEDFIEENKLLEKRLAEKVVMDLIHIVFYKTIPCSQGNHCKHYPRKIVHKNDFLDIELDCYFYHHEKDRRRFVLNNSTKEFRYAGNFADNKKVNEKAAFSQNFFESLFHPLYYKNFKCVRTKCGQSVFCPYFHSEEEKTVWTVFFKSYFGKDREVFTKKKAGEEDQQHYQRMKLKKTPMLGKGMYYKNTKLTK